MTKSFDEELLETIEKNKAHIEPMLIPSAWKELLQNHGLANKKASAIKHLNVSFSNSQDETLILAEKNKNTLTKFRKACLSVNEITANSLTNTTNEFTNLKETFNFKEKDVNAFSVLFSHFVNPTVYPIGNATELHLSQVIVCRLLLLTRLFGFKKNANMAITDWAHIRETSFPEKVVELLNKKSRPDNIAVLEITNPLSGKDLVRIKFVQQDKITPNSNIHQDFLKVVATIRCTHSHLLNYLNLKSNVETLETIYSYGLLFDENNVQVIGMRAKIIGQSIHYELVNNGIYPILPKNEKEFEKNDLLISFILQASKRAIDESEIINKLKSASASSGGESVASVTMNSYAVKEGDTLIFNVEETKVVNVKIDKECLSDTKKTIFMGKIEHKITTVPVFVKVFNNPTSKLDYYYSPFFQKIYFLPTDLYQTVLKARSVDIITDCMIEV